MFYRSDKFLPAMLLTLGLVALNCTVHAADKNWQPKKLPWGAPDLQGIWTNATITPLERDPKVANKLVVSEAEAKTIEENEYYNKAKEEDAKPSDPNAGAFDDGNTAAGYNAFWIDPGKTLTKVNGEYHTSIVVDPESGRVPYSPKGQQGMLGFFRNFGLNGPEQRLLGERCLVGFGSTGGPPMLPVLYNNNYQIVQSEGTVAILVEMNHDVRLIRIDDKPLSDAIHPWLGDSVGHWDGNTLVVSTTKFHPQQSMRAGMKSRVYVPPGAKVTERFTRVAEDEIRYEFTVEDPETYTQTWKGALGMRKTDGPIFEYACHEGNYALPGILAGARAEEQEKAKR